MLEGKFKMYEHNPPHLFTDDCHYMITAAIYQKQFFLDCDWSKGILLIIIQEFINKFHWKLIDWVILNNHYHMIMISKFGKDLSKLIGGIHRKSANIIKNKKGLICSRFWWNYWDTCPKNENQLFAMKNYIYYNPIKHGIVKDLKKYAWSSFVQNLDNIGREEMELRFKKNGFEGIKIKDDF